MTFRTSFPPEFEEEYRIKNPGDAAYFFTCSSVKVGYLEVINAYNVGRFRDVSGKFERRYLRYQDSFFIVVGEFLKSGCFLDNSGMFETNISIEELERVKNGNYALVEMEKPYNNGFYLVPVLLESK